MSECARSNFELRTKEVKNVRFGGIKYLKWSLFVRFLRSIYFSLHTGWRTDAASLHKLYVCRCKELHSRILRIFISNSWLHMTPNQWNMIFMLMKTKRLRWLTFATCVHKTRLLQSHKVHYCEICLCESRQDIIYVLNERLVNGWGKIWCVTLYVIHALQKVLI